ncbi:hypothetical protein [Winogradskyella aurantia]|uniref:Alpha/beta hydrolase n=1 Tax=Winogradskyella aurantia TaxID=1915063 RepID=A0A265UZ42_9FLAO|nr:hypothetical protein [Winogradskyella aurantia]OZV70569.1 hypothetical protein CA834_00185 [Winogradskyella aurantia]
MYRSLFVLFTLTVLNCTNDYVPNANTPELPNNSLTGTGFFEYSDYEPFSNKVMNIYYHVPPNSSATTPMLFVFHGAGRNAKDYRNAMLEKANTFGFIIIAPEFSITNFPGGDAYNLGNVFVDGDNPSPATLNPEEDWTFSVIDPLFDFIKTNLENTTEKYHVFGHSAGGQFAHRFVMFKPNARIEKVVASASGWYTVPTEDVSFPYGFNNSPLENLSLNELYDKNLTVLIGDLDNDPNAPGLRHNVFADAQGINRFARAQYFYNLAFEQAQDGNLDFNWVLEINNGADHNYVEASLKAADLIFND